MQGPGDLVYCRHCKGPMPATAAICPRCQGDQRVAPAGAYAKQGGSQAPVIIVALMAVRTVIAAIASMTAKAAMTVQQQDAAGDIGLSPNALYGAGKGFAVIISVIITVIMAVGILGRKPWARIVVIVLSFLSVAGTLAAAAMHTLPGYILLVTVLSLVIAIWLIMLGDEFTG